MPHFARIDDDNIVREVLAVVSDAVDNLPFPASEPVGLQLLADSGFTGRFLQCSYVNAFRGCYPGSGFTYDPVADVFMPPSE